MKTKSYVTVAVIATTNIRRIKRALASTDELLLVQRAEAITLDGRSAWIAGDRVYLRGPDAHRT
ncbi:MAG: hypothetical protein ACRDGN_06370 [bacterium]